MIVINLKHFKLQVINMIEIKFHKVKELTENISSLIETFDIEKCNLLIEKRLILLKDIDNEISTIKNESLTKKYKELLLWLSEYDKSSHLIAQNLKVEHQKKLVTQKKNNSAIRTYQQHT